MSVPVHLAVNSFGRGNGKADIEVLALVRYYFVVWLCFSLSKETWILLFFFFHSFSVYDCWTLVGIGIILWQLRSSDWWILYSSTVLTHRTFAGSGGDIIFIFSVRKLYLYWLEYFRWKYCLGCFHFSCSTQSRQWQFLFYMAQMSQFSKGDVHAGIGIWLWVMEFRFRVCSVFFFQHQQQWM